MHEIRQIPVAPVIDEPVRLPLRALLVVPDDASLSVAHVFNVPGVVNHLMGSAGWEKASRVMESKIFAPHWTDEQLADFVGRRFPEKERPFPREAMSRLRAESFPPSGTNPIDLNTVSAPFEIIHAVGNFELAWQTSEPLFRLKLERGQVQDDDFAAGRVMTAGRLRDVLLASQTRLLILQVVHYGVTNAARLALYVVGAGGPATVVVSGGSPAGVDRYFLRLYAEIIHNQTLDWASKPDDAAEGAPDVTLILGENGGSGLQFTRWFNRLSSLIDRVDDPLGYGKMLHAEQKAHVLNRVSIRAARHYLDPYDENNLPMCESEAPTHPFQLSKLKELRNNIDWAHERGGALPLSEIAEAAPQLEAMDMVLDRARRDPHRGDRLDDEVRELARNAPRVLNANFADPADRKILQPHQPVRSLREYDLLVDVGPRWSHVPSLVTGNNVFPEQALSQDAVGHRVEVVFFSDDFDSVEPQAEPALYSAPDMGQQSGAFPTVEIAPLPENPFATPFASGFRRPVASASMLVPAGGGRSLPILNGEQAHEAGPVRLRVRTRSAAGLAHGRLSLYYAGNLLQSAAVRVSVAAGGETSASEQNIIAVDYALSGGFRDLGAWRLRALSEGEAYPVGVNLALNGDGSGAHRLMISGRGDLTVTRPYDPAASESLLHVARSKLKECFSLRSEACVVPESEADRMPALDARNGKSLQQFKCDLFQLAWYGAELYEQAFGQLSSPQLIPYLRDLAVALKSRTVIQVARTAQAQYVYPWAMIYDIPLPNRRIQGKLKWCKVLEEWGKGPDANRTAPVEKECPFHNEPKHEQDMLCPYGIWGLKHYIEQPINVTPNAAADAVTAAEATSTKDAPNAITLGKPVAFGLGVTRDAALDSKLLKKHLMKLASLAPCTPADGADDWDDVQNMLAAPDIAYFLSHGEYDPVEKKPFLGIGPRGTNRLNRVYPDQLLQWARTKRDTWALTSRRPLVFINGCHTADLKPGEILSFVTTFANLGASGVIGTEISIRLPLATEIAEKLLERVLKGEKVGAVVHSLRWELANKGNLLGLAYTPYCRSDLSFAS